MRPIFILFLLFFVIENCYAKHIFKESDYQKAWCKANNGIVEYINSDKTRVDCLTKTHAVEFDFAKKWAEGIGQAEYYSFLTGKKGKVILIIEQPNDFKYLKRVQSLAKIHDFDVDYVTSDIFMFKK